MGMKGWDCFSYISVYVWCFHLYYFWIWTPSIKVACISLMAREVHRRCHSAAIMVIWKSWLLYFYSLVEKYISFEKILGLEKRATSNRTSLFWQNWDFCLYINKMRLLKNLLFYPSTATRDAVPTPWKSHAWKRIYFSNIILSTYLTRI